MSIFDNLKIPKVIFQANSQYNGNVEVWQVGQTLKLVANGVVQSVSWDSNTAKKIVFGRMVELLKEQMPELNSILILGLAGGTMQHLISRAFPGIRIVSVEIDKVMIDIAKGFFKIDEIPNHRIICEDACRVIVEPEKYDLKLHSFQTVIVDVFCGETYPDLGNSGNFFASLKKMLMPGGLAVFNRLYLSKHQDDVNEFIENVQQFFDNVDTLTIAGRTNSDNILIYGRVS